MAPDPDSPIRHFRPILRLSRVNRPGLHKRMVGHKTIRSWGGHFAADLAQTGLPNLPKEILANRNRQFFCAKQANFAQTGHTGRRAELCVAALQADSLSTCCEWEKRDRANKSFVILYKTGFIALSRFYHSQHVHTKNPPAVPRHTAPPGAVCGLFAQSLSVLRKKLPVSICQNFLWPVCIRFAAKCPHQLRIVLWPTIRLRIAQPRPIHSW